MNTLTSLSTVPTLVIGSTGKTGARVAERLRRSGADVRGASRTSGIRFDWSEPSTWAPAVTGASRIYLTYAPDLSLPEAETAVATVVELAREAGAERIVLLSGRGEPEAEAVERVVTDSGLETTIVRCSWFAQNFSEGAFAGDVAAGALALPVAADRREPFVDADDIADVVADALVTDRHVGQLYELTGPELLTFPETLEVIAAELGRPVEYLPLDRSEFVEGMRSAGVDDGEIALYDYLFATVLDGRNESLTDGVQRALGREPRSFAQAMRAAAQAGAWKG